MKSGDENNFKSQQRFFRTEEKSFLDIENFYYYTTILFINIIFLLKIIKKNSITYSFSSKSKFFYYKCWIIFKPAVYLF